MNSRRPYLVRALYEWIVDNGMTPYLLVHADTEGVDVPVEFVNEGRIVLNTSRTAVRELRMGNELVTFSARFAGRPKNVCIPVRAILAIYAKENGQGMFFDGVDDPGPSGPVEPETEKQVRPVLRLVK